MKIIFNLIDVLFGKNCFFEQLLINYLQFFISDIVITNCIFRKEPNFNLYSVLICLFLENVIWKKKKVNIFATSFHIFNIRLTTINVYTTELFCHSYLARPNHYAPLYQWYHLALSHTVDCNFLFLGIWFALGQSKYEPTVNGVLTPRQITHYGSKIVSSHKCSFKLFWSNHILPGLINHTPRIRWRCLAHIISTYWGWCRRAMLGSDASWFWAACGSPEGISLGFHLNIVYT